jgi:tRNA uridine 5-carbamoylmethylation protein Kti12
MDAINGERGQGVDGGRDLPTEWEATYSEAYRHSGERLAARAIVVYDAPNHLRARRDELREIAAQHRAEMTVILVDVPARLAIERWRHNRETSQRFDVRNEDFMREVQRFEPPTPDERALRYDQSALLEDWRRAHFVSEYPISRCSVPVGRAG